MTFCLEPKKRHFADFLNKVVDPIWLQSSDVNAAALREAARNPGSPWRILHQVPFVSRIFPEFGAASPVEETLRAANIASSGSSFSSSSPTSPARPRTSRPSAPPSVTLCPGTCPS